jgi:5S rRNA maturation endonuclease (ribonuclease M5)
MRNNPLSLLNIKQLYQDYHVQTAPAYHKHSRLGWINTTCPFCFTQNQGFHLGYNQNKGYFFCWRCGWHSVSQSLNLILKIEKKLINSIIKKYAIFATKQSNLSLPTPETLKMPEGCGPLKAQHRKYLINRNFNPDNLIAEWGLQATENWGSNKFRIIAPIEFEHQIVSYQGRDWTNKQSAKYKACPKEKEILPHKKILYGLDKAICETCIVVEGITDVWRLGPGAIATFGAEYTPSQLLLITKRFKKAFLLFDCDTAGKKASEKMTIELENMNIDTETLELKSGDAGDLSDIDAKKIMKELI